MERHDGEMLGEVDAADQTGNMFRSILVITLKWFKFGCTLPSLTPTYSSSLPSPAIVDQICSLTYIREKKGTIKRQRKDFQVMYVRGFEKNKKIKKRNVNQNRKKYFFHPCIRSKGPAAFGFRIPTLYRVILSGKAFEL